MYRDRSESRAVSMPCLAGMQCKPLSKREGRYVVCCMHKRYVCLGEGGRGGGLSTFDIEVSSRTRSYWITWYIYSFICRLQSNTGTGREEEWGFPWSCCDKLVTRVRRYWSLVAGWMRQYRLEATVVRYYSPNSCRKVGWLVA